MTDEEYYWEKAEFQDPESHRKHVENYKNGIHSSIVFDEQYAKEAAEDRLSYQRPLESYSVAMHDELMSTLYSAEEYQKIESAMLKS